jgi:hypothetical protein
MYHHLNLDVELISGSLLQTADILQAAWHLTVTTVTYPE